YQIEGLSRIGKQCLKVVIQTNALATYAVACRFDLPDIAKAAAKATLAKPLSSYLNSDLTGISADRYHTLVTYHQMCGCVIFQPSDKSLLRKSPFLPFNVPRPHFSNMPLRKSLVGGPVLDRTHHRRLDTFLLSLLPYSVFSILLRPFSGTFDRLYHILRSRQDGAIQGCIRRDPCTGLFARKVMFSERRFRPRPSDRTSVRIRLRPPYFLLLPAVSVGHIGAQGA
ncbi:hypothetical protein BV25DRAFT_1843801, partial [Artomyces pyxidatus]